MNPCLQLYYSGLQSFKCVWLIHAKYGVKVKGYDVHECASYPERLVMVPRVMGCLIWARGSTTVRLGSGASRGFPMLLLVKLWYESWLLSLAGNTRIYIITSVKNIGFSPGRESFLIDLKGNISIESLPSSCTENHTVWYLVKPFTRDNMFWWKVVPCLSLQINPKF